MQTLEQMQAALKDIVGEAIATAALNARPGTQATTGEKSPRLTTRRTSSAPLTTQKENSPVKTTTNANQNGTAPTATLAETMEEQVARLIAENAALKARNAKASTISFKVSEKGAVSIYGMGRFPCTLYAEQWERVLDKADDLRAFLKANAARLKTKGA